MGDPKGFIKYERLDPKKQPAEKRKKNCKEFSINHDEKVLMQQGARCMDCGVPFCHNGCPINNLIPDFNDLVYKGQWHEAFKKLQRTNNFPEFTGRLCPAPCENSCVLAITNPAVTIKNIEYSIIEKAFSKRWVKPAPPKHRTDKKVAVIGSGPSGLACADELNKAGHNVTVFEKDSRVGGLLAIGIPDFKLDKKIINRRIEIMHREGIKFKTNAHVGVNISANEVLSDFDAIVLCGGAGAPRDFPIPGRELKGIHFAMEFLSQQNDVIQGIRIDPDKKISAKGKKVVVIGGGDTGADCVGTAIRQGAESVVNFELLPQPPKKREADNPWPQWAFIERSSSSHEEGCLREYSILAKEFLGENGQVKKIRGVKLRYSEKDPVTGRRTSSEIEGSEFTTDADLVLLAMGFLGPVKSGMLEQFGVKLDVRGNVHTGENGMTSVPGIFAAGDMRRGQSLVVWAINEGRTAACHVNQYLKKF